MDADRPRTASQDAAARVILLDTHAAIWLAQGHRRARPLARFGRLHLSPVTLLELQFLSEAGRVRLSAGVSIGSLADDPRWWIDEPPAARWFTAASELSGTRDPFDRLLAAHAIVRGWKLATADQVLLDSLEPGQTLPL